jgi:orotate phosphoribosyltransferase
MANKKDILERLKDTGAILEGHFVLSSGLHSNKYIQCAKLLQHPHHAEWCGEELVELLPDEDFDVVVSPAIGGIVIGQEIARALGVRHVFVEKTDGTPELRRGFRVGEGDVAVIVEDVVTTGLSTKEVMQVISEAGGEVGAACSIVDRGGGKSLGVPFASLIKIDVEAWEPSVCPLCKKGVTFTKPGSRKTTKASSKPEPDREEEEEEEER